MGKIILRLFFTRLFRILGILHFANGEYVRAERLLLKSEEYWEKLPTKEHYAYDHLLHDFGVVYQSMGNYTRAKEYYFKSKALLGRLPNKNKKYLKYAPLLDNLGQLYLQMGDYDSAEKYFLEVKVLLEGLPCKNKRSLIYNIYYTSVLNGLGVLYSSMGDYTHAEKYLLESKALQRKRLGKWHPVYSPLLNNLGVLYIHMEDYVHAEECILESIDIHKKLFGKKHPNYALLLNNLGGLYVEMEKYERAKEYYLEAKSIYENTLGKKCPGYAALFNNLGTLYDDMEDYKCAEECYLESKAVREKILGKEHPDYIISLVNLYTFYLTQKKYPQALTFQKEANQQETILVNRIFTFLSEQGRENYWNTLSSSFEKSYSLSWFYPIPESSALNYDNALFTKGLLLRTTNAVRDSIRSSKNQQLIDKFEEFTHLRQQIGNLRQRGDGNEAYIKKLEGEAEELEKHLVQESAAFSDFKASLNIGWQKLKENLDSEGAAIEFISFRLYEEKWSTDIHYAALVLRPRFDTPQWVPFHDCEQTVQEFLNELNELQKKYPKETEQGQIHKQMYNEKGSGLYAAIWRPLESLLEDVKTVYYSPSGLLHKISFNAIPTEGGVPLMDVYDLNLVSSTREIVNQKNKTTKKPDSGVVYGGLVYEEDADDMKREAEPYNAPDPEAWKNTGLSDESQRRGYQQFWRFNSGMAREGKKVKEILSENSIPTDLYTDTKGNKESFMSLGGKKKGVLHLATHGFFFDDIEKNYEDRERLERIGGGKNVFKNPLRRSGLVLAGANRAWIGEPVANVENGFLWADDVAGMNLVGAQLVVLSACDTALGEVNNSEGVFGLQRAFKLAGAETLIMSLWGCNDDATCELMTSFYEKWLSEKKSKQEAFKLAQRELMKKYPSPYYWAAFVMID